MCDLVACIADEGRAYLPIVHAALTHEMLLAIHPFLDGNGRTAHLLLASRRPRYIGALEQAHHGQYSALANLIGHVVEDGLDMFLKAAPDHDKG